MGCLRLEILEKYTSLRMLNGGNLPISKRDVRSYRYGFNGMEKDDEIKGEGNSYDFGARMQDPRIGRWFSRDAFEMKYPSQSPYNFVRDNPIIFYDPDGNTDFYSVKGKKIGTDGLKNNLIGIVTSNDVKRQMKKGEYDYTKNIVNLENPFQNGSKFDGGFAINKDVLSEANDVLTEASKPEARAHELSSVLQQEGNNFTVIERGVGPEFNFADGSEVAQSATMVDGDVGIHSHLTSEVRVNDELRGSNADNPTTINGIDAAGIKSDEYNFPRFKMNIIVGKSGDVRSILDDRGIPYTPKRTKVINLFGNSIQRIGTITQKTAGKILGHYNSTSKSSGSTPSSGKHHDVRNL